MPYPSVTADLTQLSLGVKDAPLPFPDRPSKPTEVMASEPDLKPREVPPIRIAQRDGEDPMGYYVRLAHENGLANPSWLFPPSDNSTLSIYGRARCCTLCLAKKDPFWREDWSRVSRPWCAVHKTWLRDECANCGRLLTWHSVRLVSCRCGSDLRTMEAIEISAVTQAILEGGRVPVGVLLWLGAIDQHGLTGKAFKKLLRRGTSEKAQLLEAGARWASSPDRLGDLLEKIRIRPDRAGSLQLLSSAFPGLRANIRKIPDQRWETVMANTLQAYVQHSRTTNTPIGGSNKDVGFRPRTQTNVAKSLGIAISHLTEILTSQKPEAVPSRVTLNGRTRRFVPEAAVEEARRLLADRVCQSQAAALLGVKRSRLKQLLKDGFLHETNGVMSRCEVAGFIASIVKSASCDTPPLGETVSLSYAFQHWVTLTNMRPFVQALLAGDLKLFKSGASLSLDELFVVTSEIVDWSQSENCGDGVTFTVVEAARRLGVKQSVAYDLVNRRLLGTEIGRPHRRLARVVTAAEVARFKSNYVALAALGENAGIAPKHRHAWAVREGMDLVTGPLVDGCTKYFVRRSSLTMVSSSRGSV